MQKHMFMFMLLISGTLLCSGLYAGSDDNAQLTPEQMMRLTFDIAAYKNIIKAASEASQSPAYREKLEKFKQSLEALVQTYAREFNARITHQEREVIGDILKDARQAVQMLKEELEQLDEYETTGASEEDYALRERVLQDTRAKINEQIRVIAFKTAPFALAAEELSENSDKRDTLVKDTKKSFSSLISFIDSIIEMIKN
jgi:hypothetical protein